MSVSMLSEQLAKVGCFIDVYTTTANGIRELEVVPDQSVNIDGVTVTYYKRITKDHSHLSPALLKAVWQTIKGYDAVHIHAWWNLVSVFSCMIALMRDVPVLVSARGTLSPYSFQNKNKRIKSLIHYFVSKPLLKRCHFHVTSDREKSAINSVVSPKDITNIPNFVRLSSSDHITNKNTSSPLRLIFLSRIEEKKGLDILIKALPLITFPYTLTIAGDGEANYIAELKALSKLNKVDHYIQWAGFQNDNKFGLLAAHDLLILPSHDENFGNVVIESLSQGTAVLLSKFVGLSTYVTQNNLGWECELDPADIALQLNLINNKQQQLSHIRKTAPEKILVDFNEDQLVQQYITMYHNIITNG